MLDLNVELIVRQSMKRERGGGEGVEEKEEKEEEDKEAELRIERDACQYFLVIFLLEIIF